MVVSLAESTRSCSKQFIGPRRHLQGKRPQSTQTLGIRGCTTSTTLGRTEYILSSILRFLENFQRGDRRLHPLGLVARAGDANRGAFCDAAFSYTVIYAYTVYSTISLAWSILVYSILRVASAGHRRESEGKVQVRFWSRRKGYPRDDTLD